MERSVRVEQRISKIEKDLALMVHVHKSMGESLEKMAENMNKLLDLQMDTKLQAQRLSTMDREAHEAFERVYKRLDKLEGQHGWVAKTIVGSFLTGGISLVYYLARQ